MRANTVVFDLDGTLADTMPLLTDLAVDLIVRFYDTDPRTARMQYLNTIGRRFEDQLALIFPGHEHNETVARLYRRKKQQAWLQAPLVSGASGLTRMLQLGGSLVFIVSSTERDLVQRYVAGHEIAGVVPPKSAGELKRSQLAWVRKSVLGHMTFIGDAPYDQVMASEVGVIDFIAVGERFKGNRATPFLQWEPNLRGVYGRLERESEK